MPKLVPKSNLSWGGSAPTLVLTHLGGPKWDWTIRLLTTTAKGMLPFNREWSTLSRT